MNAARIRPDRLKALVILFYADLEEFFTEKDLQDLLVGQVDHIAIKAADRADYEACLHLWVTRYAREAESIVLNDRQIATMLTAVIVPVGSFGETNLLEIMEPKSERIGRDNVGLDHIEVMCNSFAMVKERLDEAGVAYTELDNGHHKTLVVVIPPDGQEVKFVTTSLYEITRRQRAERLLTVLK